MELNQLLLEALNLMLVGMLCVGVFLGVLVILIPVLNKITPDEPATPVAKSASPSTPTDNQYAVIAAISAAVQQYRNKHK